MLCIARKATGPETSLAMTTSQRTMTTSPGETSSTDAWASRIFSASVCPNELLQVVEYLPQGDDVPVLGVDVVQARCVGVRVAVADRLARHDRPVAVLERVDDGCAHAPGCRGAGDDQAVAAVRSEEAREGGAEEGRREELHEHRFTGKRFEAGIDLHPPAPDLEREQCGHLVDEGSRRLLSRLVI